MSTASATSIDATQRLLRANSRFSLLTGAALAVGGPWLAGFLGPPAWLLSTVGAGVLVFGLATGSGARRRPRSTLPAVLVADLAWIVGIVTLLTITRGIFTPVGVLTTIGITGAVAWFAWKEAQLLRTTTRAT